MVFIGRYTHSLDSKGRLVVPQNMRETLTPDGKTEALKKFVLTASPDEDSLHLYTPQDWSNMMSSVAPTHHIPDRETLKFLRAVARYTQPVDVDQLGRINLPDDLRAMADLGDEAIWIGATNHAEIWNPKRWKEAKSQERELGALWDARSRGETGSMDAGGLHGQTPGEKPDIS